MVTFDSRDDGTPAAVWRADPRFAELPPLTLPDGAGLIVFAAHPDDETLGAGGLITASAAEGREVTIVMVTDGAGSDADASYAATRALELAEAIALLAPDATIVELRMPDGGIRERRDELGAAVRELLSAAPPNTVIVAPWRGDAHRDHRIVGEAAVAASGGRMVLEYPVWMWHWASPAHTDVPWERMHTIPIDVARKRRAIETYRSQIDGPDPMLRPSFLEHFSAPHEIFFVTEATAGAMPDGFFDVAYSRNPDPWRLSSRWYEERKRALTVASLPRARFERAVELGCSVGMLTDLLADRCDDLLAVDVSELAVAQTRARVGDRARVERMDAVAALVPTTYELVVLSEIGYYFDERGLDHLLARIVDSLRDDGVLVACHWRHPVAEYPLSGDAVHARVETLGLPRISRLEEADFVLEVFAIDGRSVAAREGLT